MYKAQMIASDVSHQVYTEVFAEANHFDDACSVQSGLCCLNVHDLPNGKYKTQTIALDTVRGSCRG